MHLTVFSSNLLQLVILDVQLQLFMKEVSILYNSLSSFKIFYNSLHTQKLNCNIRIISHNKILSRHLSIPKFLISLQNSYQVLCILFYWKCIKYATTEINLVQHNKLSCEIETPHFLFYNNLTKYCLIMKVYLDQEINSYSYTLAKISRKYLAFLDNPDLALVIKDITIKITRKYNINNE